MIETVGQPTVVVALSGGVDSAVAAARLVQQGHEVIGVTLRLLDDSGEHTVPSPEAAQRARATAQQLDIPFRIIDARDAFKREVVDYFVSEYASGRTPNPCVRCNRFIRFGLLMDHARALGASTLATGHYAQVREADEEYQLLRGRDRTKDQSYFLHMLDQRQLAHTIFPLGRLTKEHVRASASRLDLPVVGQAESQDVCFLVKGDYRQFLRQQVPQAMRPGPIRDTSGRILGEHRGLGAYTIGQRKGLGISAPHPLYVIAIDSWENAIVVGAAAELGRSNCSVESLHFVSGEIPSHPFRAEAQIRYRARPTPVSVHPIPGARATVHFSETQRDITPGQSLVLYDGNVVLGGGIICESRLPVL